VLAIILSLLAVVSIGYVWWSTDNFSKFAQCQAEWSTDLLEYQISSRENDRRERAVNDFEIVAISRLISDAINPDIESEDAISKWQESRQSAMELRRELQEDRENNPLPEPPLEVCNGLAGEGGISIELHGI
jgi:hypothetical protein